MALRTSTTAVWFAAATILLAQLSPATLPAALVMVISTTRLLYSQWRLVHPVEQSSFPAPVEHPYFDPPPAPRFRELVPGLAASLAIQAGALIFPVGYPLLAAALFCLSVAMVTLCGLRAGAYEAGAPSNLPRYDSRLFAYLGAGSRSDGGRLSWWCNLRAHIGTRPFKVTLGPCKVRGLYSTNFSMKVAETGKRNQPLTFTCHLLATPRSPTIASPVSFFCRKQSPNRQF